MVSTSSKISAIALGENLTVTMAREEHAFSTLMVIMWCRCSWGAVVSAVAILVVNDVVDVTVVVDVIDVVVLADRGMSGAVE